MLVEMGSRLRERNRLPEGKRLAIKRLIGVFENKKHHREALIIEKRTSLALSAKPMVALGLPSKSEAPAQKLTTLIWEPTLERHHHRGLIRSGTV